MPTTSENALDARPPASRPPPRVPDHEMRSLIGQGSYGEVWLARSVMGTWRAVKVVYRDRFENSRPYEREWEGIQKFEPVSRSHEDLMDVLQVGRDDVAGCFYYVMELADNAGIQRGDGVVEYRSNERAAATQHSTTPTLQDPSSYRPRTLRSDLKRGDRLPVAECARTALALAGALDHLHRRGLVHRDIKPSNIIFVDGTPKLADIGLVTDLGETCSFVGTEGFVAPEGPGTPQADIYGLGRVIYELATGKDRREFPELPTNLADLPERAELQELNEVIVKACEHDPRKRYASAADLRADLLVVQSGKSLRRLRYLERRLAGIKRAGAGVAVVLALGTAFLFWQRQQATKLQALAEESRERLVRLNVASGMKLMDEGDYIGSVGWFVEALKLVQGDPAKEEAHRWRIGAVLQRCPLLIALGAHRGSVNSAEFSPDGTRIVTSSDDGTARVWDAATSAPITPPLQHAQAVNEAYFSPDGTKIVTASDDHTAQVWNAATGRALLPPLRHEDKVVFALFSRDGQRIVTASDDKTARIWNSQTGQLTCPPLQHTGPINCAEFSTDGSLVVTASDDDSARVWDAHTGQAITEPFRHEDDVAEARFDLDGKRVVTASRDGTARIWSVATGEALVTLKTSASPWLAAFSSDGKRVLTAGGLSTGGGEARVWDATTGVPITAPMPHGFTIRSASFSPDERWIVTACRDRMVRVWDAQTGQLAGPTLRLKHHAWSAVFSPDGRRILTAGRETIWRLWQLPAEPLVSLPALKDQPVRSIWYSLNGQRAVVAHDRRAFSVWDVRNGLPAHLVFKAQGGGRAVFSADGRYLVTVGDSAVRLWDCSTGKLALAPMEHQLENYAVVVNQDATVAITTDSNHIARVWRLQSQSQGPQLVDGGQRINCAAFSPNGRLFATGSGHLAQSGRGEAWLWYATTGLPALPPLLHDGAVTDVAFSPDGSRLLTGCDDKPGQARAARVWDVATGRLIGSPMMHPSGVTTVAFSPDGRWVASGSQDGVARIWHATTGLPLTRPLEHNGAVAKILFSPDGKRLATIAVDATFSIWDVLTGDLLGPPIKQSASPYDPAFSPDGNHLLIRTHRDKERKTGIWKLRREDRPVEDLEQLAQLLASARMDGSGGLIALSANELEERLRRLRLKYPEEFKTATGEREIP